MRISWSVVGLSVASLLLGAVPAVLAGDANKEVTKPDLKALAAAPVAPEAKNIPQDNDYVVHEWGTFTSFSGSDGVALDFRPLVDEDLPAFVLDRAQQTAMNARRDLNYARGSTEKGLVLSKQRMETPVTYFYTDRERIVDASVEFPHGLLTEFYPPVRQFGPAYVKGQREPLENSWLRWGKIRLIPQSQAKGPGGQPTKQDGRDDPLIPKVRPNENPHYAYARETDSAHVQMSDPALSTYREKFLFYRGVGNFDLPVRLQSLGQDRFTLSHSGKTPLHFAFLVQVDPGGSVRFAKYDGIATSVEMTLPSEPSTVDALADDMASALVSDGLFDKEARAMVKTWRSSWFGEAGTRVLYSLPRENTDALLPLHLTPAPKEMIRVMIGRLETLTPEQERGVESLISHLGDNDPAARDQATAKIRQFGRFAEPALTRVARTSVDPEVQIRARTLLQTILPRGASPATPAAQQ